MTASEIAEQLILGNISDARLAIVQHHTQQQAAVLTLDVMTELLPPGREDFDDWRSAHDRLRRCLTGGT